MSSTSIIKLDIGGTQFKTSKTTLTRLDSFFKTLMETEYPVAKEEPIFVDRSPKHFEKILNYMRDSSVVLPKCPEEVREIQNEAQYYLLTELVELCITRGQAVKEPMEIRELNNLSDKTIAIVNSPKKAVLIFSYDDEGPAYHVRLSEIILKYQEIIDVFFTHDKRVHRNKCTLYDKTNNKHFECGLDQFEQNVETKCAHLF